MKATSVCLAVIMCVGVLGCDSGEPVSVAEGPESELTSKLDHSTRDAQIADFLARARAMGTRIESEGDSSEAYILPKGFRLPDLDDFNKASETFATSAGKSMAPGSVTLTGTNGLSFSSTTVTGSASTDSDSWMLIIKAGSDVDYSINNNPWLDRTAALASVAPGDHIGMAVYGTMITGLYVTWRNKSTHNASLAGNFYSVSVADAFGNTNY